MKFKTSQFVLTLAVVLGGAVFWFLLQGAAAAPRGPLLYLAAADFVLYLAFLGISFLLLPVWLPSLAVFLGALPMLFFFELNFRSVLFVLAISLLAVFPALRVRRESEARLKFALAPMLRKGLPLFLTFVALALAVFFYPAEGAVGFKDIVPERIFEEVFGLVGKNLPLDAALPFPVPDLNKTVDEAILSALPQELGVNLNQILKPERERLLAEARSRLSQTLGVKIKGNVKVGEALYAYLMQSLEERFGVLKPYLPALYAFGVFVLARSVFIVAGWLGVILAWLLVKLGLGTGFLVFDERPLTQRYLRLN